MVKFSDLKVGSWVGYYSYPADAYIVPEICISEVSRVDIVDGMVEVLLMDGSVFRSDKDNECGFCYCNGLIYVIDKDVFVEKVLKRVNRVKSELDVCLGVLDSVMRGE